VNVILGKAFVVLRFIKRLPFEFRDPYTLKSIHTSLVRLKLEDASCVWSPFYDVRVDKVERVRTAYLQRCARLRLETLVKRRSTTYTMFIFDILSGRINSTILLSALALNTPRYRTGGSEFLRIGFHRTMSVAMRGSTRLLVA
jgi:hypothetical protein